jgi:hypothetical protein
LTYDRAVTGSLSSPPRLPRAPTLALCGAALTLCAAWWALTGDQTRTVPAHLVVYAAAFLAYALALPASRGLSRRGLVAALGLAAVWRLALVPAAPLLSDDVHRYVWEGRIQLHGGNPYAFGDRPEAERWAALRDDVWRGVNWKDYSAIYPPLWQLAARAVVRVHDSVAAMKLFLVGCELAFWWGLALVLRRRGLPAERLLIVAWSPLALVEIAGSGHNEAFGLLFVAGALLALDAGRTWLAAVACALAFQAKLVPGLLAAAWVRRFRPRDVLAAALLAALLVVPYAGAGRDLLRSLGAYSRQWIFNETGFALLMALTGSRALAVRAALLLLAAPALALAWRRVEPARAGLLVIAAWLLLMPSVLPWYVLWLLPFLAVVDRRGALPSSPAAAGAFVFTGTVALAYLVYPAWLAGAPWQVGWDVRAAEYLPCLLAAGWSVGARRRAALTP